MTHPPTTPTVGLALGYVAALVGCSIVGCLVEPNPKFIADETSEAGSEGAGCPVGQLDCDGEPGCEAFVDDPLTCGSCNKQCEVGGMVTECVVGQCLGSVTLLIDGDAHVDADLPDQNFGTEPSLRIDATHHAYLALPEISEPPSTATIDSATLHLSCVEAGATVEIYRVEAGWDELDLTYANAPATSGQALLTLAPEVGHNVIELVDLLDAWQNGAPSHSLGLRRDLAGGGPDEAGVEFVSAEGGAVPYLVLTLSW